MKHSILQIYFTGTGANAGHLHVDDWTVWYERDQRGLPFKGYCTNFNNDVNITEIWRDDAGETCETFETKTTYLSKMSYCEQYGDLVPLNGVSTANVACCACGGGTYNVQLLDAKVMKHPTLGRVDLYLPRKILNGEILVVKYQKHPTNMTRWVGGWDGLFSNSWDRIVVDNNVWPTLIKGSVSNDNTSLLNLQFTGRGIIYGTSSSLFNEFTVILEDCRRCSLDWHEPVRTYVNPILIEYVTSRSNELVANFGKKRKRRIIIIGVKYFLIFSFSF